MKKSILLILAVLLFGGTYAQKWNSISSDNAVAPKTKLVSNTESQIVVNFQLGGFYTNSVATPEGKKAIVEVPKMVSMLEAGAPDLPLFAISAIIGDAAEMNVKVVDAQYVDFQNMEIAPSKGNFSRQINPDDVPYTYGSMYNENAFYPATQATLESPYILRDFRGQNIMVTPFAYNATTKTLRVYYNLTLSMNKISDNGVNQKAARKSNVISVDPEVKAAYSSRFINYEASTSKYDFIVDEGDMLVICPSQYLDQMQEFVDWKNMSGRPTTIVSTSETGTSASTVKAYVQNAYNSNPNLTYILLVGDYADIQPNSMSSGASDNFFGMLDGSDYYIEAFVGRFSVESSADLANHINKILYYERDMTADVDWVDKGIGIGAIDGAGSGHNGGEADYVHMDYIRDTLMHYSYSAVTQQYSGVGSGTSATAISADFNDGKSMCNYCNHGSETSWGVAGYSNSHVNALTNDYEWPIIWSVACLNGKFNYSQPCFAETWMRATDNTTGAPTGAVGTMMSWISQPWTPPMTGQDAMVDILTEWKTADYKHTLGGCSLNGNMAILDLHPSDNGETHNTWILFGDPSMMVRTANPTNMNVSHSAALLIGMSELQVTAQADFAIATLTMNGQVLGSTYIENGTGTISFSPLSNVGNAQLCVLGYNRVTYMSDIEVIPADGSYVTVNAFTPAIMPFAQQTALSIDLKNVGSDPTVGNSTVTLTTESEVATIINGETTCGVIAADEIITLEDAFTIELSADVTNEQVIPFTITIVNGNDTWASTINIKAVKPEIEYAGISWPGSFTAGSTITVVANFTNEGSYRATNAVCVASSTQEGITIATPSFALGTIEVDGTVSAIYEISISENFVETDPINLHFALTSDNDINAEGDATLKNSCNVIFTMADSYGDGWNGAKLVVAFSDGSATQNLTMTSGSSAVYTIEIGSGVHVTVSFTSGQYDSECSFSIAYEGGETLYTSSGTPTAGVVYEFDCSCGGGSSIVVNPIDNLVTSVNNDDVTLTWNAPTGEVDAYVIKRNGVEIETVSTLEYLDADLEDGTYNYCVIATYQGGQSIPVCAEAIVDVLSVGESESEITVYPNPTNSVLNISVNGTANDFEYSIINAQGQILIEKSLGSFSGVEQINISNCAKGMYFLRMTSGSQTEIKKIFVE